jgi:hypothetical protein
MPTRYKLFTSKPGSSSHRVFRTSTTTDRRIITTEDGCPPLGSSYPIARVTLSGVEISNGCMVGDYMIDGTSIDGVYDAPSGLYNDGTAHVRLFRWDSPGCAGSEAVGVVSLSELYIAVGTSSNQIQIQAAIRAVSGSVFYVSLFSQTITVCKCFQRHVLTNANTAFGGTRVVDPPIPRGGGGDSGTVMGRNGTATIEFIP